MRLSAVLILAGLLGLSGSFPQASASPVRTAFFEISDPNGAAPAELAMDQSIVEAIAIINQTLKRIFGLPTGISLPGNFGDLQFDHTGTPFLPNLEALLIRIRSSRFQMALEGGSDLEWLGADLYLNELQGSLGIQIDLLDPNRPDLKLAVRLSPATIDIAWVQDRYQNDLAPGSIPQENTTPIQVRYGVTLGLFFEKLFRGDVRAGIHAVARPNLDTAKIGNGISLESAEAIFVRIPIKQWTELFTGKSYAALNGARPRGFELEFRFSHFLRDQHVIGLIEEGTREISNPRDIRLMTQVFEGAVFLTWRN
jgi:hypothetical protein